MHTPPATAVDVTVVGIVRGRDINQPASIDLGTTSLSILWQDASPWELAYEGIDGISANAQALSLFLHGGDVIELRAEEKSVINLKRRLSSRLYRVPEVTRGLRSLGSLRGVPGAAHDRWFAPFLAARRSLERTTDCDQQLQLFDAQMLRDEFNRAIEEIAVTHVPEGGAARRALEAALEEEAARIFVALAALDERASALRAADVDVHLAVWRNWVDGVRSVFAAVDECWAGCGVLLSD